MVEKEISQYSKIYQIRLAHHCRANVWREDQWLSVFLKESFACLYFQNVADPATGAAGTFFADGYEWLKVPVYFVSGADTFSISVHADRNLTQYWPQLIPIGSDIPASLKEQVYAIDAEGNRAERIETGVWYDLYIPVNYTDTDLGITYVNIYTNGGTEEEPSVMYVKPAVFMESYTAPDYPEPEEPADPSVGNLYVREEYKAAGLSVEQDADGVWTYSNPFGGLDGTEGVDLYYGDVGVFFMEISASDSFFTNGYRLIRLQLMAGENVTSITLRFGQNSSNSYWVEKIEVGKPLPARTVYLYDADGKMAESLERNEWYTLYIPVEDSTALNSLQSNGGSSQAPAVMYLKDVKYVNAISETSSYIFGDTVTQGEEGKVFTSVTGQETMLVNGVTRSGAATAFESTGEFFRAGFRVVKMDVKFGDNTAYLNFKLNGTVTNGSEVWYSFTVGQGAGANVMILDENGSAVGAIEKGVWYSIYMYLDYSATEGWTDFLGYLGGGSEGAPATLTVRNVEFMKELPSA